MNLAIVLRELSTKELKNLLSTEDLDIFTSIQRYSQTYPRFRYFSQRTELITKIEKDALEYINELGHSIFNKKKLIDHLTFDSFNAWYYIRHKLFNLYTSNLRQINLVNCLLDSNKLTYKHIAIYSSFSFDKSLLNHSNCSLYPPKDQWQILSKFRYLVSFILRACLGCFQLIRLNQSAKYIVFTNPFNRQNVIDFKTGNIKKGDPLIEYLFEKVAKNKKFILLSELPSPPPKGSSSTINKFSLQSIFDFRFYNRKMNFEVFVLMALLNFRNINTRSKKIKKSFHSTLQKIEKNTSNKEQKFIIQLAKQASNTVRLAYLREHAAHIMLRQFNELKSIGGEDEHTIKNRPILEAAKRLRVNTYGIQHGGINNLNINYIFSKRDSVFNPIPDYTITRGTYTNRMLSNCSIYKPSQLKALGHCRTDSIPMLHKLKKSDVISALDNTRPTILYAAQPPVTSEKDNILLLTRLFLKLSKELPEVQFILKPHPNDKKLSYLSQIASELDTSNYILSSTELYRLLAISDVVLTYYSTVGTEAIYFKKPLLVYDPENKDRQGYIKDNVGIKVTNYKDLLANARMLIDQPHITNSYEIEEYVRRRSFKIDGKTTDRYLEFITSIS